MTRSLRDIIHDATHRSHARFDAALTSVDLRRPDYYASFLRGQAEALFPLEAALEDHDIHELLPDWEQRRRAPALAHDLAALDIGVDPPPAPRLARGDGDPTPEMLGVCYVLEGSRLSERVILSRIADEPDPAIMAATAYLRHGFGRRFWPSFLATLENHPAGRADPARVIAGAELAFAMFERALPPTASNTPAWRRAAAAHIRAA